MTERLPPPPPGADLSETLRALERRLHELERALAGEPPSPPAASAGEPPADEPPSPPPAPGAPTPLRWARIVQPPC